MRRAGKRGRLAAVWLLPLLLSACVGARTDVSLSVRNPNKETNRRILTANQAVLGPVSEAVNNAIPSPVHDRLHDLNSNLKEPRIFVNNMLQLRFGAAGRTATRFVVNST